MEPITYAIGDVHGRRDLLDSLLDQIELDAAVRRRRAKIVFCGDYVDRGPDSRGVIERLIAGPRRPGDEFLCLAGNHDLLFVRAVTTDQQLPDWAWSLFLSTRESYDLGRKLDNAALWRHAEFYRHYPWCTMTASDCSFMPVSGPAYLLRSRSNKTSPGFASSFSIIPTRCLGSWSMGKRSWATSPCRHPQSDFHRYRRVHVRDLDGSGL